MNKMKQLMVLSMLLLAPFLSLRAQSNGASRVKPLKLYTQLGSYRDSVSITVAEAEALIAQPLKIIDEKKLAYSVSSYIFIFKKTAVTEDEQTGKTSPTTSMVAQTFKQTPLPSAWLSQVRDQVKPGDELHFVDILARDAKGKLYYASNLKLIVTQ